MGGKAAALAELSHAGLPIPSWFVISPAAYELKAESFPALDAAVRQLNGPLAVRSSAVDEDGSDHSFAGQLESFLFVPPQHVLERVVDVWRSGFTERVIA